MRFCPQCEDLRVFKYNQVIGHSECKVCGARYALREAPVEKIIDEYEARIKGMGDALTKQNQEIKALQSKVLSQSIELNILRKRISGGD
jgi:transcription elongation factor Elf1